MRVGGVEGGALATQQSYELGGTLELPVRDEGAKLLGVVGTPL